MVDRELEKYDWDSRIMGAIARAENRNCDPEVHNLTMTENHGVCVGSYGVLQVGCLHYRPGEDRDDLKTNIKVAYRAWTNRNKWGNGYEAWTTFRKGTYKQFLSPAD